LGRERELGAIAAFLSGSSGTALLLEGDPGIGKTTLWRAATELARSFGCHVVEARPAEAERELSYAALSDLVSPLTGWIAQLPAPQRFALEVALLIEEPAGAPPDRRAVGAALLSLLRDVAAQERVLVAIDDLQWLDSASASAFAFAFRRIDHPGLQVVAARRSGEPSMDLEECERLTVGPLRPRDLDLLVRRRLGVSFVAPVVDALADTSGGNALYALELARELLQRDEPLVPGAPLPVPASLRSLIETRFKRLPRRTQDALAVAAALRQPTVEAVEAATDGRFDLVAEAAGIVTVDGDAIRFGHPLFASVVYGSLGIRTRRRLHRRLAAIVDDVEERARHLAAATAEPDEAVAALLDEAGGVAARRGAPTNALTLAERALELTPTTSPARIGRHLAAARARFAAGDAIGAKAALETVLPSLDGHARASALLQLGLVVSEVDGLRSSIPIYRSVLDIPSDVIGPSFAGLAHARLAQALTVDADQTAMRHAELGVEHAERGEDSGAIAEALAVLAQLRYGRDRVVQSELLERALVLGHEGQVWPNNNPLLIYGQQYLDAGTVERASPLLERAVTVARERRDPSLNFALVYLAWRDIRIGETRRAIDVAEEARALARLAGRDEIAVQALAPAAVAKSIVGDEDACRRDVAEMIAHGESRTAADFAVGLLELSLENWRSARDVHAAGLEAVHPDSRLTEIPGLVEALLGLGETTDARRLINDEWPVDADSLPPSVATARLWHALGLLRDAERDTEGALAAFDRAFAVYDAITANPVHRGRVLLARGIVLRRRRRRREARDALDAALVAFRVCDAAVWARRAEAELAVLGGRPSSPTKLTAVEQRIAELVARGRSNDEVARDIHLSPKTVEWNLTKIYRKLGVGSRAELAAKLARRQIAQ
jgi:DNA-binding CsgD family transcriptional regulator/Tfp pilus assembly protein PilF